MAVQETDGLATVDAVVERIADFTVVDVDVHLITVDPMAFEPYIDDRYAGRLRHLARTDEPLARSLVGSFDFDLDPEPHGLDEAIKTTTPEGFEAFIEAFEADYILIHGHQLEALPNVPEPGYAAAICAAHNDHLLDNYLDHHPGFKGSIVVAPQAPELAAEEIHRLADEDDMVNVHITASINGLLGDPKYHPIYEAADEEGLAITVHPGYSNPPWSGYFGGPFLQSTVASYSALGQHMLSHLPSLVFQGVPERFPDVDFVFLEQGVTWIPWMQGRMDHAYERRKHELEWLDRPPSDYVRDHFYFGTQPLEEVAGHANLRRIFEMIDAEHTLMYSTDFPHFDFDFPSVLNIPKLPESTERAIFGENAMRVLDL